MPAVQRLLEKIAQAHAPGAVVDVGFANRIGITHIGIIGVAIENGKTYARRLLPTLVFCQAVTLDVFDRALHAAHKLTVVSDAHGQQDRGEFR